METRIGATQIELIRGNIVDQAVDAIVNAANRSLLGGGGVDGAIHYAAGPQLLAACRPLQGCATGDAKITPGYKLPARHVIHAVGPVYHGRPEDAELLASAYRRSLEIAAEHGLRTIAFPAISTGAYAYPLAQAAQIALHTVITYAQEHRELELVRFVLWDREALATFTKTLKLLMADHQH